MLDPSNGKPTRSCSFEEILPNKKETDAVNNITTGGSPHMTVEERMMPAPVFKPEFASLNMGSMNLLYPMLDRLSEFEHIGKEIILRNHGT